MNLDFGVLWIEDSFSKEEESRLKQKIQSLGFIARIENINNGDKIGELSQKNQLFHCYDIVLLDYKLKDAKGDVLAVTIRRLFPSTTILFYSGSEDEANLKKLIANQNVEGVYCSHRDRFVDRTGALIEQTVQSLNRLSGMRGLAMRVVAECDAQLKTAILSMTVKDKDCRAKLDELDADVFSSLVSSSTRYQGAVDEGTLEKRLETRAVDSAKLFAHSRRLSEVVTKNPKAFGLTDDQADRLRELRQITSQYVKEVLGMRNVLGHVIEVQEATGWALKGSTEIRAVDFPIIREKFATYTAAIEEMTSLVT